MYPSTEFHEDLDRETRQAREREQEETFQARYKSEQRDRELVRRALEGGIPDPDIESRLVLTTQFVRLNPDRDVHAYARALIEEEKSGFHALSAPVPPSADDSKPEQTGRSNPISQLATNPERSIGSVSKQHATEHAETSEGAPHTSTPQAPALNPRAEASEAAVREYLSENFEPSDWLAVLVRNRETGETIHRMSTARRITSQEFQRWLRYKNAHGSDIYLSLNTFKDHARNRTKADLKQIRHLYLDLDEAGPRKLAAIRSDNSVPAPHYVLNTSPDKYQVIWKVEGIDQEDAEALLRALAQRFGSDPAATDSTRVFRLPGFSNKKYERDFQVILTRQAPPTQVYHAADFDVQSLPVDSERAQASSTGSRFLHEASQSEKDWAYAILKLKQGEDPELIIRDMARYRSVDRYDKNDSTKLTAPRKPNPRYYAEHTVARAMAELGITRQPPPNPSAQPKPSSAEMEPPR